MVQEMGPLIELKKPETFEIIAPYRPPKNTCSTLADRYFRIRRVFLQDLANPLN